MTLIRQTLASSAVVLTLSLASAQAQPLSFAARAAADAEEGKPLESSAAVAVVPPLLSQPFPPKPTRKDERMSRAESMFEEGRKLFQAGDLVGARKLFDEALDLVLNAKADPVDRAHFDKRFEELVARIYRLDVSGLGAGADTAQPSFDKAPIDDILSLTFPIDPKIKPMVRDEVAATISQLPLEATDAVISFINYFSSERGRGVIRAGLRRAGKYKPMISRILDEEGIPQEFIFLAQAESGFLPRAVSFMSAGGMWQFIRGRGSEYGLRQDNLVDERFDPELATRAAARHLRDLYHQFGDWYLAIAAYNCGPANVDRAVERTGYADVWELRSRGVLPLETSNYVPIILAMTIMSKNPQNYGLDDIIFEEPLVYDTVELNAPAGLSLIADLTGQPAAAIKELNPALLRDIAPAGYRLHVPKGSLATLQAGLELVPADKRLAWRVHRTEAGEDLPAVARKYGTSPASLASTNAGLTATLEPGSLVVIPAAPPRPPVVAATRVHATSLQARGNAHPRSAAKPARAAAKPPVKPAVRPNNPVLARNRSSRG
ncbi:MAG: transglycosylase SLT domain-containing protein [Acidobacteriota bacterium]|jgi:membrane-bound lytic murein transglycosylase D|nr:transglycosylase SLT domain-containing protein [Acidobacteriaceae bacterium]